MSDQVTVPDKNGNSVVVVNNAGGGGSSNNGSGWRLPSGYRTLITAVVLLAAVYYVLSQSWSYIGPRRPVLDNARRGWVKSASVEIAKTVIDNRAGAFTLVLCDFANEPTGELNEQLRLALESKGGIDLLDQTLMQKIRHSLGFRPKSCDTPQEAGQFAKKAHADLALIGRCNKLAQNNLKTDVDIQYQLIDTNGKSVYKGQFENISDTSLMAVEVPPDVKNMPWMYRLLLWILFILLLPVITISFLTVMTAKESNLINAFVLVTYTVISGIVGWLLMQPDMSSNIQTILFVIIILITFIYNGQIMVMGKRMNDQ